MPLKASTTKILRRHDVRRTLAPRQHPTRTEPSSPLTAMSIPRMTPIPGSIRAERLLITQILTHEWNPPLSLPQISPTRRSLPRRTSLTLQTVLAYPGITSSIPDLTASGTMRRPVSLSPTRPWLRRLTATSPPREVRTPSHLRPRLSTPQTPVCTRR